MEEFLQEMDEDTEGMQGTILYLQSQLRQAKEKISHLTSQLSLGQNTSNNTPASVVGEGADYTEGSFSETEPDEGRTLFENSDHNTKYLYKENNDDDESTLLLTASNNNSSNNRRPNGGEIMANITCSNSSSNNNNNSCISGLPDALHNNNNNNNTQLLTTVKNFASRRNSNGGNTNKRTCSSVLQHNDEEEEEEEGEEGQENSGLADSVVGNSDGQTNDQYPHASPPSPPLQHVSKRARLDRGGTGASEEAEHVVENGLTMK